MDFSSHFLVAGLTGILSGFVVSFVPGPVNVAIINEGARRGFIWGLLIGLGSAVMEIVYCSIAFAGFTAIFSQKFMKAALEVISFLLMIWLGLKYLRAKSIETRNPSADKIEQRIRPHSAFMIGFVQVLGNPGILLMWIALAASFISHDWVNENFEEKLMCVSGVAIGAVTWFVLLAYAVSRKHKKISNDMLLWMEHFSGILLLVIAFILGIRIVLLLAAH